MPKFVPLVVLGLVTLGLGYEFYTILSPFLLPLFLAGVLAMLADPLHQWFKARYPKQPSVAAGLTTATVIAVVLLPFALATVLAAGQLIQFTRSAFKDPAWQKQIAQLQASPWVAKLRTERRNRNCGSRSKSGSRRVRAGSRSGLWGPRERA